MSQYKHFEILKGKNKECEAKKLLLKLASFTSPLMKRRGWVVNDLIEFYPTDGKLGLCQMASHTTTISIKLRETPTTFYPFETLLDTLLHELCHIQIGGHTPEFYKLWNQLRDEMFSSQLERVGNITKLGSSTYDSVTNNNSHNNNNNSNDVWNGIGRGNRLGGPQTTNRLGGDLEMRMMLSPVQAAAMAAQQRFGK